MDDASITCSDDELVLTAPIASLPRRTRKALVAWLVAHDVDPHALAIGHPVQRDAAQSRLTFRVESEQGRQVVSVYAPLPAGSWPAPFPCDLLAEPLAA